MHFGNILVQWLMRFLIVYIDHVMTQQLVQISRPLPSLETVCSNSGWFAILGIELWWEIFNLRRLQAKSKVQIKVLNELLLADDMAKGAPTEEKLQKGVDQVSDSCDSYDLTIKKTEMVYQPAPGKPYKEPTIRVKGQCLQMADKFTLEAHCLELCTLMMK